METPIQSSRAMIDPTPNPPAPQGESINQAMESWLLAWQTRAVEYYTHQEHSKKEGRLTAEAYQRGLANATERCESEMRLCVFPKLNKDLHSNPIPSDSKLEQPSAPKAEQVPQPPSDEMRALVNQIINKYGELRYGDDRTAQLIEDFVRRRVEAKCDQLRRELEQCDKEREEYGNEMLKAQRQLAASEATAKRLGDELIKCNELCANDDGGGTVSQVLARKLAALQREKDEPPCPMDEDEQLRDKFFS